jgi:MFS transporter, ACS family, tartrate transporter
LTAERRQREAVREYTVMQALITPRVIGLSLVYLGAWPRRAPRARPETSA